MTAFTGSRLLMIYGNGITDTHICFWPCSYHIWIHESVSSISQVMLMLAIVFLFALHALFLNELKVIKMETGLCGLVIDRISFLRITLLWHKCCVLNTNTIIEILRIETILEWWLCSVFISYSIYCHDMAVSFIVGVLCHCVNLILQRCVAGLWHNIRQQQVSGRI